MYLTVLLKDFLFKDAVLLGWAENIYLCSYQHIH